MSLIALAEPDQRAALARLPWPAALATVVGLALLLRVVALDARPLGPAEAGPALEALALGSVRFAGYASGPVLPNVQSLLFAAFGASDAVARLPAALVGALTVGLLVAAAPYVGRGPALAAGLLLAASPLALLAHRSSDPAALVALALALVALALHRALVVGDPRWAGVLGAGLALGLGSDPAFVPGLLVVALAAFLAWWRDLPLLRDKLRAGAPLRPVALGFALVVAGLTMRLFTAPPGLGAGLLAPLVAWTGDFAPLRATGGALEVLVGYEAALLVLALLGWVLAGPEADERLTFLGLWALLGVAVALLAPEAKLAYLVPPLLPLALLAGLAVDLALRQLAGAPLVASATTATAATVPVVYVLVAQSLRGADAPLALAIGLPLFGLILLTGGLIAGRGAAVGAVVLLAVAGVAILSVSGAGRLVYSQQPIEPLLLPRVVTAQAVEVRETVQRWVRAAPDRPVPVDERLRPLLGWSLRDLPEVDWRPVEATVAGPAVLSADGVAPESLAGRRWDRLTIAWVADTRPDALSAGGILRRLLRREPPVPLRERAIIVIY